MVPFFRVTTVELQKNPGEGRKRVGGQRGERGQRTSGRSLLWTQAENGIVGLFCKKKASVVPALHRSRHSLLRKASGIQRAHRPGARIQWSTSVELPPHWALLSSRPRSPSDCRSQLQSHPSVHFRYRQKHVGAVSEIGH